MILALDLNHDLTQLLLTHNKSKNDDDEARKRIMYYCTDLKWDVVSCHCDSVTV